MKLMAAWKDSLSIFTPKKFKLFLLVTLNALKQAYAVFFRYWWWLILLVIIVEHESEVSLSLRALPMKTGYQEFFIVFFIYMMLGLLVFLFFLSTRPSVERKDLSYFSRYGIHSIYYFISLLIVIYLGTFFREIDIRDTLFDFALPLFSGNFSRVIKILMDLLQLFLLFLLSVSACFYVMFLLDNDGSPSSVYASIYRSIKMTLFNLPFVIITVFIIALLSIFWAVCMLALALVMLDLLFPIVMFGIPFIITTFSICFVANFYTQKLHEQYSLYFKRNE